MNKVGDPVQPSKAIDELIKAVPSSSIPLPKPPPVEVQEIDPFSISEVYWAQRSQELVSKYNFGKGLGKFGNNNKETALVFSRLTEALIEIIRFECNEHTVSTEDLKLHFDAISSTMMILAKEVERKNISSITYENLLATLHGFIESYVKEVLTI